MNFRVKIMGFNRETNEKQAIWVDLPCTYETLEEQAGVNARLEEITILEQTLPFDIGDVLTLAELNFLVERLSHFYEQDERILKFKAIADKWFGGNMWNTLHELDKISFYRDVKNYKDLANKLLWDGPKQTYVPYFMRQFLNIEEFVVYVRKEGGYLFVGDVAFHHLNQEKTYE